MANANVLSKSDRSKNPEGDQDVGLMVPCKQLTKETPNRSFPLYPFRSNLPNRFPPILSDLGQLDLPMIIIEEESFDRYLNESGGEDEI